MRLPKADEDPKTREFVDRLLARESGKVCGHIGPPERAPRSQHPRQRPRQNWSRKGWYYERVGS
jgi:hypothetical protein